MVLLLRQYEMLFGHQNRPLCPSKEKIKAKRQDQKMVVAQLSQHKKYNNYSTCRPKTPNCLINNCYFLPHRAIRKWANLSPILLKRERYSSIQHMPQFTMCCNDGITTCVPEIPGLRFFPPNHRFQPLALRDLEM